MEKQKIHILGILMMVIIVSESSVIVPRSAPSLLGDGELEKDKKLGWSPGIWDPSDFKAGEFDTGIDPEDDDSANKIDKSKPGANPESYPSNSDRDERPDLGDEEDGRNIHENDDGVGGIDKTFEDPFDGEEDYGGDGEPDKPVFEDGDEDRDKEDDKSDEEDYDKIGNIPAYEDDEDFGTPVKGPGFFGEGPIFDAAFFNLGQVRRYFHQLEKALEHTFKQTVDEARLLNGTYANTTEEEVDINGKKFVVHKSVIKGANNRSSIYVETLSSKEKEDEGQDTNGTEVSKNETHN